MNVVIEAFLVGIYSCLLYLFISPWIYSYPLLLFCVGFTKHILGYFLGIHTAYCKYGNACKNTSSTKYVAVTKNEILIKESVIEGILYVFAGVILQFICRPKWVLFILIGFLFHIFFEWVGIHSIFCKEKCSLSP